MIARAIQERVNRLLLTSTLIVAVVLCLCAAVLVGWAIWQPLHAAAAALVLQAVALVLQAAALLVQRKIQRKAALRFDRPSDGSRTG